MGERMQVRRELICLDCRLIWTVWISSYRLQEVQPCPGCQSNQTYFSGESAPGGETAVANSGTSATQQLTQHLKAGDPEAADQLILQLRRVALMQAKACEAYLIQRGKLKQRIKHLVQRTILPNS